MSYPFDILTRCRLLRPSIIFQDPYQLFCMIFTLILAFGIGLSTANFGALVRYKIPFMPFFVSMFFIMNWRIGQDRVDKNSQTKPEDSNLVKLA